MDSLLYYLANALLFAAFVYSVIAHEVAHGWVALRCGDRTALLQGRLTANPIPHIDPVMTLVLPLIGFWSGVPLIGGAKPVPVNTRNLRRMPRDWILVSLAGVAANLLIALACAGLLHALRALGRTENLAIPVLEGTVVMNIGLLVFNLVPIPPLDGSRAFRFLIRDLRLRRKYDELERYGMIILVVLIQLPMFNEVLRGTRRGSIRA